jgi:head-tail adaptor
MASAAHRIGPEAGTLRQPVSIERPAAAAGRDGYGRRLDTADTWTAILDCNASIEPVAGVEALNAERLKLVVSHTVVIRWAGVAIDATCRVIYRDPVQGVRYFAVRHAQRDGERIISYKLLCEEVVNPATDPAR